MAKRERSIYRLIAIALVVLGSAAFGISWYQYAAHVGTATTDVGSAWGVFGDFIGGFAGTIISLVTLVALSLTLDLQARELAETREALRDQADSFARQLEMTATVERRKIRPLLQTSWVEVRHGVWELHVMNVGLGAALIDRIELRVGTQSIGFVPARHVIGMNFHDEASDLWREAIRASLGHDNFAGKIQALPVAALAVGQQSPILQLPSMINIHGESEQDCLLVIHYRSLAEEYFSTLSQYYEVRQSATMQ